MRDERVSPMYRLVVLGLGLLYTASLDMLARAALYRTKAGAWPGVLSLLTHPVMRWPTSTLMLVEGTTGLVISAGALAAGLRSHRTRKWSVPTRDAAVYVAAAALSAASAYLRYETRALDRVDRADGTGDRVSNDIQAVSQAGAAMLAIAATIWPCPDAALSLFGICAYSASRAPRHQWFALGDQPASSLRLVIATLLDAVALSLQAHSRGSSSTRAMVGFPLLRNVAIVGGGLLIGDQRASSTAHALWRLGEPRRELLQAASSSALLGLLATALLVVVGSPNGLVVVAVGVVSFVVSVRLTLFRLPDAIAIVWLGLGCAVCWLGASASSAGSPRRITLPLRRSDDKQSPRRVGLIRKALQIAALLAIGVGAGGVLHRLSIGAHHHLPARALIEEDHWSRALYTTVSPRCAEVIETFDMPLANLPRTALASYPRSGNTFTRLLIERATGWHTSSLYCDRELARAFDGECALRKTGFLVKTHWPSLKADVPGDDWPSFDRVLHVVRNPLDAIFSYVMLRHLQGHDRHWATYVLGARERAEVLELGRHWLQHDEYWRRAPLPTHTIRYEDLRSRTLPVLLNTVAFLLPSGALPNLDQVACALEQADRSEAYRSGKRPPLQSLANYTPELRDELLQLVAPAWCRHGYDVLADGQLDRQVVDCGRIAIAPFDTLMPDLLPPSS